MLQIICILVYLVFQSCYGKFETGISTDFMNNLHSCAIYYHVTIEEKTSTENSMVLSAQYKLSTKGASTLAFCEMELFGGGWTMLLKNLNNPKVWTRDKIHSFNSEEPSKNIDHSKLNLASNILVHELTGEFVDVLILWLPQDKSRLSSGLILRIPSSPLKLISTPDDDLKPLIIESWGSLAKKALEEDLRIPWITRFHEDVLLTMRTKESILKPNSKPQVSDLILRDKIPTELSGINTMVFARESLTGPSVELISENDSSFKFRLNNQDIRMIEKNFRGMQMFIIDLYSKQIDKDLKLSHQIDFKRFNDFVNENVQSQVKSYEFHQKAIFIYWNLEIDEKIEAVLKRLYSNFDVKSKDSNLGALFAHLSFEKEPFIWWEKVEFGKDSQLYFSTSFQCIAKEYKWSSWSQWSECSSGIKKRKRYCCAFIKRKDDCPGNSVQEEECAICETSIYEEYEWPTAESDTVTKLQCTKGRSGKATRTCQRNGKWGDVDESQCVNAKIANLKAKVDSIKTVGDYKKVLAEISSSPHILETKGDADATIKMYSSFVGNLSTVLEKSTSSTKDELMNALVKLTDDTMDSKSRRTIEKNEMASNFILKTEELAVRKLKDSFHSENVKNESYEGLKYKVYIHIVKGDKENIRIQGGDVLIDVNRKIVNRKPGQRLGIVTTVLDVGKHLSDHSSMNKVIGSDIVSVTTYSNDSGSDVKDKHLGVQRPVFVKMVFKVLLKDDYQPTCVYLDDQSDEKKWRNDGCQLFSLKDNKVTCGCNHTTNYAVLMQVVDVKYPLEDNLFMTYITYIGISMSIICIVLMMSVYHYLRNLQSVRIQLHKCLVIHLLIAQIVFLLNSHLRKMKIPCIVTTAFLHYLFTSVFAWMLAEGIHLLILVLYPTARMEFTPLIFIGVVLPVIVVLVSWGINFESSVSEYRCWLNVDGGMIYAFVGPAITIIAVNVVILVIILYIFLRVKKNADKDATEKIKAGLRASLILLPIFGITWIFGVFSINQDTVIFAYIFCILNSTQGVFIFVFHVILNDEVKSALRNKLRIPEPQFDSINKKRDSSSLNLWVDFVTKVTGFSSIRKKNKVAPVKS